MNEEDVQRVAAEGGRERVEVNKDKDEVIITMMEGWRGER